MPSPHPRRPRRHNLPCIFPVSPRCRYTPQPPRLPPKHRRRAHRRRRTHAAPHITGTTACPTGVPTDRSTVGLTVRQGARRRRGTRDLLVPLGTWTHAGWRPLANVAAPQTGARGGPTTSLLPPPPSYGCSIHGYLATMASQSLLLLFVFQINTDSCMLLWITQSLYLSFPSSVVCFSD